jgi:hypothetical protein
MHGTSAWHLLTQTVPMREAIDQHRLPLSLPCRLVVHHHPEPPPALAPAAPAVEAAEAAGMSKVQALSSSRMHDTGELLIKPACQMRSCGCC